MSAKRILAVLIFLAALATLSAGVSLALQATSASSPLLSPAHTPTLMLTPPTATETLTPAPNINITMEEYDRALAQWRSFGIDEYEMDYQVAARGSTAGSYTFRVRNNFEFELTKYAPAYPNPDKGYITEHATEYWNRILGYFTVESGFRHVKSILTGADEPKYELTYCLVTFDPVLGYPSVIDCKNRPGVYDAQSRSVRKVTKAVNQQGSPVPQLTPVK